MLPESYRSPLLALEKAIDRLTRLMSEGKLTLTEVEAAQQIFQEQVLPLELDDLDPTIAAKLQSIQTEIAKQFRLLSTDVLFLKAARQATTASQRQQQIGDRLRLLRQYCEVMLGQAAGTDE